MKNIAGNILIGLMGAGKTTLGRQIARQLGANSTDSDHEICTRTGVSVPTIFELEGEQGFRERESAVIDELSSRSNIVLATGGGAVMREENRQKLRTRGTVVYLHAHPRNPAQPHPPRQQPPAFASGKSAGQAARALRYPRQRLPQHRSYRV